MGVMKTFQGETDYSNIWSFKTVVTEINTSINDMTSIVRVENFLGRVSTASFAAGNYKVNFDAGGQHYDENLYIDTGTINAGGYVSLGYHDFTIKHVSEPTTIEISGSFSSSAFSPYNGSASGSVTLTSLHQHPLPDIGTIKELNQKLINAGIGEHYFVSNLSKKSFPISGTTYDGATISKYLLHNGNTNIESDSTPVVIDFASTPLYYEYSEQYSRNVAPFSVGVRDSFGLQAYFLYDYNYVIPYVKPNLIPTASNIKRNGQLTGKVKLNLTGTFYNNEVGTVSNGITLSFKYWKVGTTEPTTYNTIPTSVYTISGNNIMISNWEVAKNGTVISDVDKSSAYKFKIKAIDSFDSISEIELICSKGEWLMAKFKNRVDFKKITQGGQPVALEPTILYDNEAGSTGNINLSDSAANYNYLEIYIATENLDTYSYQKVYKPNGKNVGLYINNTGVAGYFTNYGDNITINGTSIVRNRGAQYNVVTGNAVSDFNHSTPSQISIVRVLGYK